MLTVEDVLFHGIDSDVLQHADEIECAEFLDEADSGLNGFVVIFQRGEEEGQDYGQADDLHDACHEQWRLTAEVDEAAVHEDRVGGEEGRGFAD